MKILSLRMKNLNSLVGECFIDFSDPSFCDSGFFAITGPTGAGKSTILDAICLALYGKTPRLGKVTDPNDIMSTNTGECLAEVVFGTNKGTFKSNWHQKRAHKDPDGKLQAAERRLSDVSTDTIIETKTRDLETLIEEYTGMNFERFTRTMMLAQGGFAAFLDAPTEKKADILEQITGTTSYSELSKLVFLRNKEEEEKVTKLEAEIEALSLLTHEEEERIHEELKMRIEENKKVENTLKSFNSQIGWLSSVNKLQSELQILKESQQKLTREDDAFSSDRNKYVLAKKARQIESKYNLLCDIRNKRDSLFTIIEEETGKKPILKIEVENLKTKEESIQNLKQKVQHDLERDLETAKRVRHLDHVISTKGKEKSNLNRDLISVESDIQKIITIIGKKEEECKRAESECETAKTYLLDHVSDDRLSETYRGIESYYSEFCTLAQKISDKNADLVTVTEKESEKKKILDDLTKKSDEQKRSIAIIRQKIDENENLITNHLNGLSYQDLNDRINKLAIQKNNLKNLCATADTISQTRIKISQYNDNIIENTNTVSIKESENVSLKEKESLLSNIISDIEFKIKNAEKAFSVAEIRKELKDGTPCPVCGSVHHPYADGNVPEIVPLETELQTKKEELTAVQNAIYQNYTEINSLSKVIEVYSTERLSLTGKLDTDLFCFHASVNETGIDSFEPGTEGTIKKAYKVCNDEIDRLSSIKRTIDPLFSEIERTQQTLEKCQDEFNLDLEAIRTIETELLVLKNDIGHMNCDITGITSDLDRRKKDLVSILFEYGYSAECPLDKAITELYNRKIGYEKNSAASQTLSLKIDKFHNEIATGKEKIEFIEPSITNITLKINDIDLELAHTQAERNTIYGTKDPEDEEQRLKQIVTDTSQEYEQVKKEREDKERLYHDVLVKITQLENDYQKALLEIQTKYNDFIQNSEKLGFLSEEDYANALLPADNYQDLEKKDEELKTLIISVNAQIQAKEYEISIERAKNLTQESIETLNTYVNECEQQRKESTETVYTLQQQLNHNLKLGKEAAILKTKVSDQRKQALKWAKLNRLIGSADGKKFRSYAQGLTLSILLYYTNEHLRKLSDRYFVTRNQASPLEIHIIDKYRANEIRPTKNLSGGESFIVSLALALGLSEMTSRNVRVESLFLDEGFGTLDEEALDMALSALANMRQEGKLIGIISHVQAIKDRIPVQIRVEKGSGGKSRISGPGCSWYG